MFTIISFINIQEIVNFYAKSKDPDQMPHSADSNLGLYCCQCQF